MVFCFPREPEVTNEAAVINPRKNKNLPFSSSNSDRCLEIKLVLATDGSVEPFAVGTQICAGWLTAGSIL